MLDMIHGAGLQDMIHDDDYRIEQPAGSLTSNYVQSKNPKHTKQPVKPV